MNYFTHKQLFYVDSHNKMLDSDTHSDFHYEFTDINNDAEYDSVVLLDCSIPKSNYVINTGTNTFTVIENLGAGDLTRVITLPVGNYNRQTLKNVLKTQLNANANTYIYDITYDNSNRTQDDGKYTFTWTNVNGGALQPQFIFTDSLYEQTGFNKNTTYIFTAGSLKSVNVVNLRPESTMYILSNICQNKNNNILQNIISSDDNDYNFVVFHNPNPSEYSKTYTRNKANVFKFTITDEDFNKIDLNGINVVFTIMLYKRNQINRLIEGFIKMKTLKQK